MGTYICTCIVVPSSVITTVSADLAKLHWRAFKVHSLLGDARQESYPLIDEFCGFDITASNLSMELGATVAGWGADPHWVVAAVGFQVSSDTSRGNVHLHMGDAQPQITASLEPQLDALRAYCKDTGNAAMASLKTATHWLNKWFPEDRPIVPV
jgi:hypothetical protein